MTLHLTHDEAKALESALWHYFLKLEPRTRNNIKEHAVKKAKHLELVKELRQKVMAGGNT